MTRKEAFAQLIERRNWYVNMKISPTAANTHKKRFKEGKNVSLEFMARALNAAGYSLLQPEHWQQ
jgi:hypothetical protein